MRTGHIGFLAQFDRHRRCPGLCTGSSEVYDEHLVSKVRLDTVQRDHLMFTDAASVDEPHSMQSTGVP